VTAEQQSSFFVPAIGKVIELGELDDFVWATLQGWGALPAHRILRMLRGPKQAGARPEEQAAAQEASLREEENDIRLLRFTNAEAGKNYPYLFSLAAVRLWAMIEAAVRELLVECLKRTRELPNLSAVEKLRGPVFGFIGATPDAQAELLADLLWQSSNSPPLGVGRYDALVGNLGLRGESPTVIAEITRELSEVRHCVVHRGGRADDKLLQACPWLRLTAGDELPANMERFWYYRTATYWYVIDLGRRWAQWRSYDPILRFAEQMEAVVLEELNPSWQSSKQLTRPDGHSESVQADA
jgi:hypothetical protein